MMTVDRIGDKPKYFRHFLRENHVANGRVINQKLYVVVFIRTSQVNGIYPYITLRLSVQSTSSNIPLIPTHNQFKCIAFHPCPLCYRLNRLETYSNQ